MGRSLGRDRATTAPHCRNRSDRAAADYRMRTRADGHAARHGDGDHHNGTDACGCRRVQQHNLCTTSTKKKYTIGCIFEEDLVPELRSLLNVFDGVIGAGNYWEKIQDAMEMAESDHPEARSIFDSRP